LGLIGILILIFLKDLSLHYIPAAFLGGLLTDNALFYKGLIASLFIPIVSYADRKLLMNLDIKLSRKWFSRKQYLRILKATFLGSLYFSLFWIWQWSWLRIFNSPEIQYISWFSFHCLFFIVAIPWLAHQRSSFLPVVILISAILTGIYPSLLSLNNLHLLDLFMRHDPEGLIIFPVHTVAAVLFLVYLGAVWKNGAKAFKDSLIASRIILIYITGMFLFVAVTEMILWTTSILADSSVHTKEIITELSRAPMTGIICATGILLLIWGLTKRQRFTRILGLILLIVGAGKLLYYDLPSLKLMTRILLLFVSGAGFFLLSHVYSRIRRKFRKKSKSRTHLTKRHINNALKISNPPNAQKDETC